MSWYVFFDTLNFTTAGVGTGAGAGLESACLSGPDRPSFFPMPPQLPNAGVRDAARCRGYQERESWAIRSVARRPQFGAATKGDALLAWTFETTETEWTGCEDLSFYHQFIPRFWAPGGDEVAEAPIHRFCTLARKMGVASFLIEDAHARPGVADEIAHLASFMPAVPDGAVTARSITFLRRRAADEERRHEITAGDILSQMIVIEFPMRKRRLSYVHSAVARLCALPGGELLLNNFVPVPLEQGVEIDGRALAIPGTFFCQQNGVTSVCGHTAVRTLVMNASGEAIPTAELNAQWCFGPDSKELPRDAVEDALRTRGMKVVCYDLDKDTERSRSTVGDDGAWTVLTGLVESGTPSLLVLQTGPKVDHVVPVIGHTVNTDEWHPQGAHSHLTDTHGTTSSSLWIDHLVINDDQLGPYYCLSRAGLFDKSGLAAAVAPRRVIAVLPDAADTSPLIAETLARGEFAKVLATVLATMGQWRDEPPRWLAFLGRTRERRIFRTILMTRDDYAQGLRADPAVVSNPLALAVVDAVTARLPEAFWMVEVSLPNIMLANKDKLGELLIPICGGRKPRPVAVRLPGALGTIGPEGASLFPFPIEGHVPMRSASRNDTLW